MKSCRASLSSRIIRALSVVTVLQIQIFRVLLDQHFIGQKYQTYRSVLIHFQANVLHSSVYSICSSFLE
jgi:hypothetical protein